MRFFFKDGQIYALQDGQFLADESEMVDVTEHAEDIKKYSATHTPELVDGVLTWTEKTVPILNQIEALENSITLRNTNEAILGNEYALNKIKEVQEQIAELREQL